jgi:hypothetical protein
LEFSEVEEFLKSERSILRSLLYVFNELLLLNQHLLCVCLSTLYYFV